MATRRSAGARDTRGGLGVHETAGLLSRLGADVHHLQRAEGKRECTGCSVLCLGTLLWLDPAGGWRKKLAMRLEPSIQSW